MEEQWFIWRGQEKLGPMTLDELNLMIAEGKLQPEDCVGRDGGKTRISAQDLIEQRETKPNVTHSVEIMSRQSGPSLSGEPLFYRVCQVNTLVLGVLAFIVIGVLALFAIGELFSLAQKTPQSDKFDTRSISVAFALLQLASCLVALLLDLVITTLILVFIDTGRRVRDVQELLTLQNRQGSIPVTRLPIK